MSIRPFQAFLLICPFAVGLFWFDGWQKSLRAQGLLRFGQPITGKVVSSGYLRHGTYRAELKFPASSCFTRGEVSLSRREFDSLKDSLEVYPRELGGGSYSFRTATSVVEEAGESPLRHAGYGAFFGLPLAWMLYYLVVRIRVGSPRKSLKERWEAEKSGG